MNMKNYYIYMMTNQTKTLYVGVTNNLEKRVYEHKNKLVPGFTRKYNITSLVWFEETSDISSAIAREKQIKGRLRSKKIRLIESLNPNWNDLGYHETSAAQILRPGRFAACPQDDKVRSSFLHHV